MKQFVKALDKSDKCFKYICQMFPGLSMEKLKANTFVGPQICALINDNEFKNHMTKVELEAWTCFVLVNQNFLGKHKSAVYSEIVTSSRIFKKRELI